MKNYEIRPELKEMCREIILEAYNYIALAGEEMLDKRQFEKLKNKITAKFKGTPPRNIELIQEYNKLIEEHGIEPKDAILTNIIKNKIRTLSGIANITVMLKAYGCPGKCIFCPTQPKMPKSYFSTQPAMLRAVRNDFHCYQQMKARLNGLKTQGHDTSKIDVRTAGGTWSSYKDEYLEHFVKSIYFALNEGVGEALPQEEADKLIEKTSLEELIKINETAKSRCVGLWVETRPDWVDEAEIRQLRRFGVTGIELGIQTTDDKVNEFNQRGHGLKESTKATELARNSGMKICHHIMPNLPKSTFKSDLKTAQDLFKLDGLKPDYIKVYPCVVVPFTQLKKMIEKDPTIYQPYSDTELAEIIIKIKNEVPEYCRIIRILRDFPSEIVLQGTKCLNMRQILKDRGVKCKCIRCREIKNEKYNDEDVKLVKREYKANNGKEIFLSYEDIKNDKLIGLLRLRIPKTWLNFIPEIENSAIIRELHVYGQQKSLTKDTGLLSSTQHKGYGTKLIFEAEKIAKKMKLKKISIISAIGTREYYKKLGYELEGTYMVKAL